VVLPQQRQRQRRFGWQASDLEAAATPIFVLSDLDSHESGMSEPFEYPDQPMDRGKVLDAEELSRLGTWGRYQDVDGDGIGWRTLPGLDHPAGAYFARGTGHNANAVYSERPEDWVENMARLTRKFNTARTWSPGR
jgi:2-oxoglutarate ferredoxin oxidoreductase subunit alpha